MASITKTPRRKRINLMMDTVLLKKIDQVYSPGKRSDFVNEAVQEKLTLSNRRKAFVLMGMFQKKYQVKTTGEEIRKLKQYGRK